MSEIKFSKGGINFEMDLEKLNQSPEQIGNFLKITVDQSVKEKKIAEIIRLFRQLDYESQIEVIQIIENKYLNRQQKGQ
jgi:hypothetical protein